MNYIIFHCQIKYCKSNYLKSYYSKIFLKLKINKNFLNDKEICIMLLNLTIYVHVNNT